MDTTPARPNLTFASLTFTLLGLSVHFCPAYGSLCAEVLAAGWTLLLISAVVATMRAQGTAGAFTARGWRALQLSMFAVGVLCVHVFVTINYLKGEPIEDDSYEAATARPAVESARLRPPRPAAPRPTSPGTASRRPGARPHRI